MKKPLTEVELNVGIARWEKAVLKTAREMSVSFSSGSLKEAGMKLRHGVKYGLLNRAAYMAALEFLTKLPDEHDIGDSLCDHMGDALDAYIEDAEEENG